MSDLMDELGIEEWCRRYGIFDPIRKPLEDAISSLRDRAMTTDMAAWQWIEEHEDELPEPFRRMRREARQLRADADSLNLTHVAMWERYMVRGESPSAPTDLAESFPLSPRKCEGCCDTLLNGEWAMKIDGKFYHLRCGNRLRGIE